MRPFALAAALVIAVGAALAALPQRGYPLNAVPLRMPEIASLREETIAFAADWRWFCNFISRGELNVVHDNREHTELRAIEFLNEAFLNSRSPQELRKAISGLARLGSNMTEVIGQHPRESIENDDPAVRAAAADAIGLSFDDMPRDPIYGVSVAPPWFPEAMAEPARFMFETRLRSETDAAVSAAMLRSLARLPLDFNRAASVEATLSTFLTGNAIRIAGAVGGLEILTRRAPKRPLGLETIRRLRDLAEGSQIQVVAVRQANDTAGVALAELLASIRRLAVLTLHESNNDNDATLIAALRDGDWQVRRMAAEYLLTTDDRAATELERVLVDTAFQVRIAALRSLAPRMRVTLSCSSLLSALDDPNPAVVMNAIDVAPANCTEKEVLLMWLRQKATSLGGAITSWHVPARALAALVRFKDPAAREINATVAATHLAWEVRQLSASLAETLKDEATALTLAADREANVRAMAMRALTTLKSTKRGPIALTNLQRASMGQGPLLLAAAAALPDTTPIDDVRKAMEPALSAAGNTREVLLGLIARYRKFPFADSRQLRLLLRDRDPLVAAAAAAALTEATGNVVTAEPYLVSPIQTSTLRTRNPARYALMELSTGGAIKIELLIDDAPITVRTLLGRWLPQYFREGFIEVSPGIGARTGGVYDNPLDGWSSVMRDELGEVRHTRGTVGMMSNGHDLVNGQFFINLIDRPDLDHGYTVFGRIVSGLENADKILPGTRITRLTLTER